MLKVFEIAKNFMMIIPILLFFGALLTLASIKGNVFRAVKNGWKKNGFRLVALSLVLSLSYGAVFAVVEKMLYQEGACAIITLHYPQAAAGMTPNKTRYNSSQVLSDEVLGAAIVKGGLANVSIEQLRSCLEVSPLIIGNTLDIEHNYMATEYQLSFVNGRSLAGLSPKIVVDVVARAYYDWFVKLYTRKPTVLSADFSELNDMEYLDMVGYFDSKAEAIENYASLMQLDNSAFRSESTGETFSSIAEKVRNFRKKHIENFNAYLLELGLAKDKPQYIAKLNYENKMSSINYTKCVKEHEICLDAIDIYERDMATVVLVPSEDINGKYYMSRTKVGTDYYADEAETSMQNAAKLQKNFESNTYVIDRLRAGSGEVSGAIDARIANLQEDYEALSDLMIRTLEDYDRDNNSDFLQITMQDSVGSWLSGNTLYKILLLMAAVFLLVLLLLVLANYRGFVFFSSGSIENQKQKKSKKKSKKARKSKKKTPESKKKTKKRKVKPVVVEEEVDDDDDEYDEDEYDDEEYDEDEYDDEDEEED